MVKCRRCEPHRSQVQRLANHNVYYSSHKINRFEVGDRIDVNMFLSFFQDAHGHAGELIAAAAVAPFRFSSEWSKLRSNSRRDLNMSKIVSQGGKYVSCDRF